MIAILAQAVCLTVVNGYLAQGDAPPSVVIGAGSPETAFYAGHGWEAHGGSILGGLDYLEAHGVGAFYATPQNAGADGDPNQLVSVFVDPRDARSGINHAELTRIGDIVRAARARGVLAELVMQERENDDEPVPFYDGGALSYQRRNYIIALADEVDNAGVILNIGEECSLSVSQMRDIAAELAIRAPNSIVAVHQWPGEEERVFGGLISDPNVTAYSMQAAGVGDINDLVVEWRERSRTAGVNRLVYISETGPSTQGICACDSDADRRTLWRALMGGASAFYAYFGYQSGCGDLTCDDWTSRAAFWRYGRYAKQFFDALPLAHVRPRNDLVDQATGELCLSAEGLAYAIYLPHGGSVRLDLRGESGLWSVGAYSPEFGTPHDSGFISAGQYVTLQGGAYETALIVRPTIAPSPTPNSARDWSLYE